MGYVKWSYETLNHFCGDVFKAFGFTEEEVFAALDSYGMPEQKESVKKWYDGFVIGTEKDIYNPWSITNFLKKKEYQTYWVATSSNGMVSKLIQTASSEVKTKMEELLQDGEIVENFDEQIVFNQLDVNESVIWSLLMASGYLKAVEVEYRGEEMEPWYHLKITNKETQIMFARLFRAWFDRTKQAYHKFIKAMMENDLEIMNYYMNRVTQETFSYFDVGSGETGLEETERFYHGFVLGLMAEQAENYVLKSNRESGFGRYDVMMIPKKENLPAVILEFKVRRAKEKDLEETVQMALQQIEEKNYDAELLALVVESLLKTGLKEFQVSVGHADFFKSLLKEADLPEEMELELREFISNKNMFGVRELLDAAELSEQLKEALAKVPDLFGSVEILDVAESCAISLSLIHI